MEKGTSIFFFFAEIHCRFMIENPQPKEYGFFSKNEQLESQKMETSEQISDRTRDSGRYTGIDIRSTNSDLCFTLILTSDLCLTN